MMEVAMRTVQEEAREEGTGEVGSVESGELEAKTQDDHHPHPTR